MLTYFVTKLLVSILQHNMYMTLDTVPCEYFFHQIIIHMILKSVHLRKRAVNVAAVFEEL